jgi:hypothetical protein
MDYLCRFATGLATGAIADSGRRLTSGAAAIVGARRGRTKRADDEQHADEDPRPAEPWLEC